MIRKVIRQLARLIVTGVIVRTEAISYRPPADRRQ